MFSSKSQLKRRTPENGVDREDFLSLLVDEYLKSTSVDAKYQVLANLANFAYDPINYEYIRNTGVLDVFIYVLKNDKDCKLLLFATGGICNLCVDPSNAEYILQNLELRNLTDLLNCDDNEIIMNVMSTLIYMYNDNTKSELNTNHILKLVQDLKKSNDKRLTNLATIFLQDVFGLE